jgi:hypothetical protein
MNEDHNREFVATVDTATGRTPFDQSQEDPSLRNDKILKICAWCRRIHLGPDHWVQVEVALQTLPLFSRKMIKKATHGVCPECFHDFLSGKQARKTSAADVADGRWLLSAVV